MERFTLSDKLVQTSLESLARINSKTTDLKLVLVGGMACQAHSANPELYRPTNDLDVLPSRGLSYPEFRDDVGQKIVEVLDGRGYPSSLGRTRLGYEVASNDGADVFYTHLGKLTASYLARHAHWKQREIDNAQELEIQGVKERPVLVHRIEDVLANKTRRIGKLQQMGYLSNQQQAEFEKFLDEDFESLGSIELVARLDFLKLVRESLLDITPENFSANFDRLNHYKVLKDLYDVCLLSRVIIEGGAPLNTEYLRIAMSTLPTITHVH
ncbi:MAG TPA: hypothetical protein VJI52_01090 [Candidatus Nanoarchaeia archaeon]|nr:hypothetical protein [Candidatus Nanoarchaeia archaeon]